MSTRGAREPPLRGVWELPLRGYVKNTRRRKMAGEVDLDVPPSENRDQVGTSARANSQDVEPGLEGRSVPPATIGVEAFDDVTTFDDDVVISSPRAFGEAKNNSRRHRRSTVVVDVDSEERISRVPTTIRYKRRRLSSSQTILNGDLYINLEGTSKREKAESVEPPLPPKEPLFNCPVCMGPLVQEMSTKCGHIFCKACIKAALAAQGKCPTCRRKATMKDTIRIYLPATN